MGREEQVATWLELEARSRAVMRFRAHQRRAAFLLCERKGHRYRDYDSGDTIRFCTNCEHNIAQRRDPPTTYRP